MRVCILDSYFLDIKYGYFDTKNEAKMITIKKMINLVKNGQNFAKKTKKFQIFFSHVREEFLEISFLVFHAFGMSSKDTSGAQKKIYEKVPKMTPEGGFEFRLSINFDISAHLWQTKKRTLGMLIIS